MGVSGAAGGFEFFSRRVEFSDPKVIRDRAMKKIGILIDHRNLATDIGKTQALEIVTTDLYRARVGIIKPQQQSHDR